MIRIRGICFSIKKIHKYFSHILKWGNCILPIKQSVLTDDEKAMTNSI